MTGAWVVAATALVSALLTVHVVAGLLPTEPAASAKESVHGEAPSAQEATSQAGGAPLGATQRAAPGM